MTFEIQVSGRPFRLWETAKVSRSIDDNTGKFSFTNSSLLPSDFPVKAGDPVRILVNGTPIVTGYVDEVGASGSVDNHAITVSGRDSTADLIDSSLPDAVKSLDGLMDIKSLSERVIAALGANIQVVDTTGLQNYIWDLKIDGSTTETCINFLMNYARKLQVYMIADGRGRLQIFRPGGTRASSPLLHLSTNRSNNVKSWNVRIGYQSRYNTYICRSQDNIGFDEEADYGEEGTSRTGIVVDSTIRTGRLLEIGAEESMNDTECGGRANEEANLRRARSTEYTALVAGVTQSNGDLWSLGDRVTVQDDFSGLRGDFLIRAIQYSIGIREGSQTEITIAPIDAYTVQGTVTAGNKRLGQVSRQITSEDARKVASRSR